MLTPRTARRSVRKRRHACAAAPPRTSMPRVSPPCPPRPCAAARAHHADPGLPARHPIREPLAASLHAVQREDDRRARRPILKRCNLRRDAFAASTSHAFIAMDLTKKTVKAKRPCADGFRWFVRNHHNGGDYQELLDALVADGRVDDACWLLDQFGPTDAVLELDELDADALVFAGSVHVRGGVEVGSVLRTGRTLRVGGSIRAGRAVTTGEDITVAGGIRCAGSVQCGGDLKAGWHVEADEAIRCGGELRAGWELRCGGPLALGGNTTVGHDLVAHGTVRCARSLRVGGALTGADSIHAAQGIESGGAIRCGMHLEAGWGIRSGEAIVAEGAIKAGESLFARQEIRAGAGYGVYAGLDVRVDAWEASAQVHAGMRPEGLMSGWWGGAALA